MTAGKQETPPRGKTTKKTAVAAPKASDKQALNANSASRVKDSIARFSLESGIDKDERRQMIAEAAYYRFQNRGCEEGRDVDDWLVAEEEVDRLLEL